MDLSVTVPEEPADGTVVLARPNEVTERRVAWQRRGGQWVAACLGFFGSPMPTRALTWEHLVVDHGPLTLLVPEDMVDGWQRAGYLDPLAERLPDAVGGPGAPTPDQASTRAEPDPEPDGPSAAEQAYTRTTTDELGGPLGGGMPPVDPLPAHLRRPIRDNPQA